MFISNEWYECTVKDFQYVESPVKKTLAFELTCEHPEHGRIVGQWWLSDTINTKGIPMWQAAKERCIKLGCNEEDLNKAGWIEHARKHVVGKTVACLAEVSYYEKDGQSHERVEAKFIGIPSGKSQSGYSRAGASVSPFANRQQQKTDPFSFSGIADDSDVPF